MAVQTNQEGRHAAVRAITGTTLDYNGDWMALFDLYNIPRNDFNGRFIRWLQLVTGSAKTNINDLKQTYAQLLGFYNWDSINTFAPLLPNCRAWWDFSDLSTLTLSGSAIVSIADKSGNGNLLVQSTGTARATTVDNSLNGKRVATFDGGDFYPIPSALYTIPNGANTIFAVAKRDVASGNQQIINMNVGVSPVNSALRIQYANTAGNIIYQSVNLNTSAVTSTGNTTTNYNIISCFRDGVNQSISINGGTAVTNTNGANVSTVNGGAVGAQDEGTEFLTGGIAEIIIYNRALSADEINQVNLYLANKWGIYYPGASWISNYSPWQQTLINAWRINKDDAFTNTSANPFAAIYDPSAAALGATTSLADTGRGVNTATEATNPPVNTANGIGSANGLLYNGTTTILNAGSNTSIDDIFAAGGCFIGVIKPTTAGEGAGATDGGRIFDKGTTPIRTSNASGGSCSITVGQVFSVTSGVWSATNRDVTLSSANIICVTYNYASASNDPTIYINSVTAKAITENVTPSGTATSDAASSMILGNNVATTRTFDGYLGKMVFLKSVPTTAQLTAVFNFLATEYGVTLT